MRLLVCTSVGISLLVLAGCASDPREAAIDSVIGFVKSATNDIIGIKDAVENAVTKANKADPKKIAEADLKEALEAIKNLKKQADAMQKEKLKIDFAATKTTPEEKEVLRDRFQKKISAAMTNIQQARTELEQTILQAEALDPEACQKSKLRSELTEAEGSFVMLARRR